MSACGLNKGKKLILFSCLPKYYKSSSKSIFFSLLGSHALLFWFMIHFKFRDESLVDQWEDETTITDVEGWNRLGFIQEKKRREKWDDSSNKGWKCGLNNRRSFRSVSPNLEKYYFQNVIMVFIECKRTIHIERIWKRCSVRRRVVRRTLFDRMGWIYYQN